MNEDLIEALAQANEANDFLIECIRNYEGKKNLMKIMETYMAMSDKLRRQDALLDHAYQALKRNSSKLDETGLYTLCELERKIGEDN